MALNAFTNVSAANFSAAMARGASAAMPKNSRVIQIGQAGLRFRKRNWTQVVKDKLAFDRWNGVNLYFFQYTPSGFFYASADGGRGWTSEIPISIAGLTIRKTRANKPRRRGKRGPGGAVLGASAEAAPTPLRISPAQTKKAVTIARNCFILTTAHSW